MKTFSITTSQLLLFVTLSATALTSAWAGPVVSVPGATDIYLAGMPDGSGASFGDVAPDQSPILVPGLLPAAGSALTFINVTGSVLNGDGTPTDPPDGDTFIQHFASGPGNPPNPENGIADLNAPLNSLVGIFLDDTQPDLTAAPVGLDFSSSGNPAFTQINGLDFLSLSPLLKQPFFIGDGLTSGSAVQEFIVPVGATRLFLGTMDGFGWFNNVGSFSVEVEGVAVPEPATIGLFGLGLLALVGRRAKR